MRHRHLLLVLTSLAVLGFAVVMLDPTCVLWGLLTGESFYQGRPTSYWRKHVSRAEEARRRVLSPPGKTTPPNIFHFEEPIDPKARALLKDPEAVAVLTGMLRDRNNHVRWTAALALVDQIEEQPPPRQGMPFADKLGPRTGPVMAALSEALLDPEDLETRDRAAWALLLFGQDAEPVIPALIAALSDDSSPPRRCGPPIGGLAAKALKNIGPPAVPALLRALRTSSVADRKRVIDVFESMGPQARASVPALRDALQDEAVCVEAAFALWKIEPKNDATIPALIRCLRGQDLDNRREAAWMLSHIGPDAREAVPALLAALSDPASLDRARVTDALKKIDPQAAARAGVP
jgi:HEAT repeat protein